MTISGPELINIAYCLSKSQNSEYKSQIHETALKIGNKTGVSRKNARIMCPFLNDNQCGIYAIRPLACRSWVSVSKEACRKDWAAPAAKKKVPSSGLFKEISRKYHQKMYKFGLQYNAPVGRFELVRALDIVLQQKETTEYILSASGSMLDPARI